MKVLVLGSGGREHAFVWKLSQSKKITKLYAAPGNPGTASFAENVEIGVNDFKSLAEFCHTNHIEMVLVGPEAPLVEGIVDYFAQNENTRNIFIIGPNKESAQLEGSKDFAKDFMMRHKIPTARYKSFSQSNKQDAIPFLESLNSPYVLKADGLAAGKGVLIINDLDEAKNALEEMLSGRFGEAGDIVVIEEFLNGIEVSVFIITDGTDYMLLPEAKDYKRIGEGDTGLNTGGMGAVSPVSFVDRELMSKIESRIIQPTIQGLKKDDMEYLGFIFIGLMVVANEPYVIEYNARMGDPETEVVIPRLKTDLFDIFIALKNKELYTIQPEFEAQTAVTVVMVSEGYPEDYPKGRKIELGQLTDSILFHSGTKILNEQLVTNGGRVMAITSLAKNKKEALNISYKNIQFVNYDGKNYRSDIGFDLD
jgi:phosphoribosylamine--glycine ligase